MMTNGQDRDRRSGPLAVVTGIVLLGASLFPVVSPMFEHHPGASGTTRAARLGPLLCSWQNVGGCGAGASAGGAGVKWVGRSVRGGLFGVQTQGNYYRVNPGAVKEEDHFVLNTLVTKELSEKWVIGVSVPFVFKYLHDPFNAGVDVSNGGLGDASVQVTRKLGPINATSLTGTLGLPTGSHTAYYYSPQDLGPNQQTGFGRPNASLLLDHTLDETWGLIVLGGVASYRGGKNDQDSYRASTASAYGYLGYFLGPFVPVVGLSTSGFTGHDQSKTVDMTSPLFNMAANVSIEWSTDWIAVLLGASFPYQYDGIRETTEGTPRSPWGWAPWIVALGVSVSPF